MKKFIVEDKVFEKIPTYCLGIVIAEGIDNSLPDPGIENFLDEQIAAFAEKYKDMNVRDIPNINAYREAFRSLSMNPNKFMCSIESLTKRVQKNAALPHINPVVDLGNALSVKYCLSMGAHDIDKLKEDLEVRFSRTGDMFLPMEESVPEEMPENELVYVSGNTVKTRRWIWRQSDEGKIDENTKNVFFPIDGFDDISKDDVLKARDELAGILMDEYKCNVELGFISKKHNHITIEYD